MSDRGNSRKRKSEPAPGLVKPASSQDIDQVIEDWLLSSDDNDDSSPTPVTVIHRESFWASHLTALDPNLSRSDQEPSESLEADILRPDDRGLSEMPPKVRRVSSPVTLFGEVPLSLNWSDTEEMETSFSEDIYSSFEEGTGTLDQALIEESDDDPSSQSTPPSTHTTDSSSAERRRDTSQQPPQPTTTDAPLQLPSGKEYVYKTASKIDIDPFAVGPAAILAALRENAALDESGEAASTCPCDIETHPRFWSAVTIRDVHRYSFLLDCKGLKIERDRLVATNTRESVVVYSVPMVDGHSWKKKGEQVLRYIDVETGLGDQTVHDTLYYHQPADRKMYLVVSGGRVQGLVLAEAVSEAHRVLQETPQYRDLEERPVPVRLGINRLWIHVSLRRRRMATALCDLMALKFFKDEKLKKEDIAFNDLTDSGVAFAKTYLKTSKVPLYTGKPNSRDVNSLSENI